MRTDRQRVYTGVLLAALILPAVWWLPGNAVFAVFAVIVLLAAAEWGRLVEPDSPRWLFYPPICIAPSLLLWSMSPMFADVLLYAAAAWWMLVLFVISVFTGAMHRHRWLGWLLRIHIVIALCACWFAVGLLHALNPVWLLYVIILTSACDTAAYYAGRRFGRSKLCPELSPGKTREGLLGALVAAFLLGLSVAPWLPTAEWLGGVYFVLLSMFVCLMGVAGDLFVSLAKRRAGAEDSGSLLPGHGGVLDRIDSFLAAALFFLLGLNHLAG